jgi:N-acetylglutamate synthase-like GNAT family acetyltransferase
VTTWTIRSARQDDIPAIEALIERSVHGLMAGHLSPAQRQVALGTVLGVDRQLIADGTYYVVEDAGAVVGAGGWSRRATLYGVPAGQPRALDPAREPARIRAMFIDPAWARRGLGRAILERAEADARAAGFASVELMATPTGIEFYARNGYAGEDAPIPLPDGSAMAGRVMRKRLR